MKIFDEHGKRVGEIEKPGPVEQDGVWWEATEHRNPHIDEMFFDKGSVERAYVDCPIICWIMATIPTPTPEQLKAIGYKLDGDRPRECVKKSVVWCGSDVIEIDKWPTAYDFLIGSYRWHLVKADPAKATGEREIKTTYCFKCHYLKNLRCQLNLWNDGTCRSFRKKPPVAQDGKDEPAPVKHMVCQGCKDADVLFDVDTVNPPLNCFECIQKNYELQTNYERKNWTAKVENAPLYERDFQDALDASDEAGRKSEQRLGDFIRDLAEKAKAPKVEEATADGRIRGFDEIFKLCKELNMYANFRTGNSAGDDILAFIRDLHRRAEEHNEAFLQATNLLVISAKQEGVSPGWEPLGTLLGVISQLDNLIAGMHRRAGEKYKKGYEEGCKDGKAAQAILETRGREKFLAVLKTRMAGEERYSVKEILDYLHQIGEHKCTLYAALHEINDQQDGIKAVTNRTGAK
jgi:hypothetical protein